MQQLKSRIEAVLFVTAKALTLEEIAVYLDAEPEDIEQALLELICKFKSKDDNNNTQSDSTQNNLSNTQGSPYSGLPCCFALGNIQFL